MRKHTIATKLCSVGAHELQCANIAQTMRKHCANTAQTCVNMRKHAQTTDLKFFYCLRTRVDKRKHAQTLRKHCANTAQTCVNMRKHAQTTDLNFLYACLRTRVDKRKHAQTLRKHCANMRKPCANDVCAALGRGQSAPDPK